MERPSGFGQPIDLGTGGEVFSIFAGFPFELELRGDGLSGEDHVVLVDASPALWKPCRIKVLASVCKLDRWRRHRHGQHQR